MADISIPGVSSKYNTTKLIDDLVAAEKIRLTRMEEQVESYKTAKDTWRQVNRDLGDLQRAVKSLYGFENPFAEKKASSSNERILTASADRTAPFENYSIKVKQVATADRFMTASLEKDFKVKAGTYTFQVGDESVSLRYKGGTLSDFVRRLNRKGEGLIRASSVRNTPNTQVLMIESLLTGSSNHLVFGDDSRSFALETGMLRPAVSGGAEMTLRSAAEKARSNTGEMLQAAAVTLNENSGENSGKSDVLKIAPSTSVRLPFDTSAAVEEGMILEYSYRVIEYSQADMTPPEAPGPQWPQVPQAEFSGLTVKSADNAFETPSAEQGPPPAVISNEVFSVEGNGETALLPDITQTGNEFQTVRVDASSLPGSVSSFLINNTNTYKAIEITDVRLYNPGRQDNLEPANPVSAAGDAVVEFMGIEAWRSTNTIDDLVDGITLDLKRPSRDEVEVSVEPDTEAAKDGIIRFVYAYNQLLTRILVLTGSNPEVIDELEYLEDDKRTELEEQLGSLRGDSSLNQLKNRLQGIISAPYATHLESELVLLAQMGVSTNAAAGSGGTVDFSKLRGYLEVDEEKLDNFLQTQMDAVKELFGNDTDGDMVIDSGVAQALDEYLVPYTRSGGMVSTRIARLDTQIEAKKDDISDYEDYLEDYENDLKRQYGNMEAMLNQLESSSRELDNFSKRQSGGR
ncbi:MAG: flagellar hook protein FliD [Spirochaetales bacterium]|nr:MAG: flagellar hook protein FliD [Spirochaetales bacterium]